MPADMLSAVVVPVAEPEDARATALALAPRLAADAVVHAVHVIEKAGGAPDKASVEQREVFAEETFEAFRDALGEDDGRVETRLLYDTDVSDAIFRAAQEADASAIAFTPRGGSRWIRLLTGDVALDLVTETDRPVVVLPDVGSDPEASEAGESAGN